MKRYLQLMDQGIVANSPEMFLTMATATSDPFLPRLGWSPQTEENINDPAVHNEIFTSDAFYKFTGYIAKVQLTL